MTLSKCQQPMIVPLSVGTDWTSNIISNVFDMISDTFDIISNCQYRNMCDF